MKKNIFAKLMIIFSGVAAVLAGSAPVYADLGISVSPMYQKIVLTPGEVYEGSFTVSNGAANDETLHFGTSVGPFYLDDDNNVEFEENGSYNQIVDWVTVKDKTGTLEPNNNINIRYTIDVPENAPAGGQYAVIRVGGLNDESVNTHNSINLDINFGVGYLIYAEVLGATERGGEILSTEVPSFIFNGDITGSSSIKNTGNVHGTAKYTMQVFPLFSNEEVFTNEEEPETRTIIPEQTIYNETVWENTPLMGIFNVLYTIEFEGVTAQVSKMVIKCPIWMLFIVILIVAAAIIWLVLRVTRRKNSKK